MKLSYRRSIAPVTMLINGSGWWKESRRSIHCCGFLWMLSLTFASAYILLSGSSTCFQSVFISEDFKSFRYFFVRLHTWRLSLHTFRDSCFSVIPKRPFLPCPYCMMVVCDKHVVSYCILRSWDKKHYMFPFQKYFSVGIASIDLR